MYLFNCRIQLKNDSVEFKKHKEGHISLPDVTSQNLAVFDTGDVCFIWVGQSASIDEKKMGLEYAHVSITRMIVFWSSMCSCLACTRCSYQIQPDYTRTRWNYTWFRKTQIFHTMVVGKCEYFTSKSETNYTLQDKIND